MPPPDNGVVVQQSQSPLEVALAACRKGLSVVPPREDGSKRPIGTSWERYQKERASARQIAEWYRNGRRGVGLVCGTISGNLELFEFDEYGTYEEFRRAARSVGLGDLVERIEGGYCEQTPGGGIHWLYQTDTRPESKKLAGCPTDEGYKTLIETKGEGGYVIIAPSGGRTHETGNSYRLLRGGVESIASISNEERSQLWELASAFNVPPQIREQVHRERQASGSRPGDEFSRRVSWHDILEPHGWTAVYQRGNVTLWRRPGKRDGVSATTNIFDSDLFYPFTTSTVFEANRGYNKFSVYAILNHHGDFGAAASALRRQGYGSDEQHPRVILSHNNVNASLDSGDGEDYDQEPAQGGRYTLHHVSEAFQPQPPIEWVVEQLFSRGSVSIIVGPPGSKKTYSMLDCAVSVALGDDWLERETAQGPVLLIDEESGVRRLNRRLHEIMKGHSAGPDSPLWYTCLEMFDMRETGDVSAIDALMVRVKPVMVLIDALADVMPGADENTVKDTHPVFQNLRALAEKHRCAVVVIHHANKAGGYRGSTAIEGAVDLMLMIDSPAGSSVVTFTTGKTRDTEPQMFGANIAFDADNGTVTLRVQRGVLSMAQRNLAESYVLRYLTEHGPSSLADIVGNADACTAKGAKNAVYSLADRGIIRRCDGGGRGKMAIYEIAYNSGGEF